MKVTKTRSELFDLYKKLPALNRLNGTRLTYAILRIKNRIASEIKAAQNMGVPSKEFLEYDRKRVELLEQYCEKDEKGAPIIEKGEYRVSKESREAYEAALLPLKSENQALVDERKKQQEKLDAFITEPVEIDFYDVRAAFLPETITVEQMELIEPFVVDLETLEK